MRIPIEQASFVVCDVETTGLSPQRESIIEIALVKIENLKITDKFSTLLNPQKFIPNHITEMTGIRNKDVINSPTFRDVSYKIQEFIGDSIFVAHNAKFDYNFLLHSFLREEEMPIRLQTLCTQRLSKRIFRGIGKTSLTALTRFFGFRNTSKHRALGDAKVTAQIFLKLIEEGKNKFKFETLDEFLKLQFQPINKTKFFSTRKSLADTVSKLPAQPGVYLFLNKKGNVIYIGKAKNLKSRVISYFRDSNSDRKVKKIIRDTYHLDFIETSSELSAFLLESELIKRFKPAHNTALKIIRNYSFIGLNDENEYPRLEVTSRLVNNGTMYFGPFSRRETAEEVLDIISKSTMLRECDDKLLKKKRPCYLLDVKRCLGPCVDNEINDLYKEELKTVRDFLTGNNLVILNRLTERMKEFASRQKFEEAAKIRNTIQAILKNIGKIKVLKEPINAINALIFIYSGKNISEVISLKNGIVQSIKGVSNPEKNLFEICDEYFVRTTDEFDLPLNIEKIKIISNFLVNKRARYEIVYTSNINSKEELLETIQKKLIGA
jgi:DNA polymerase-3 subunit epsilon